MKIKWNKVTWYSIALAVVIFAAVLVFGIWAGWQFGQIKSSSCILLF